MELNYAGASNLARVLREGHFAVATEVGPPIGPNPAVVQRQITQLRGYADAYNTTDNQSARVHMASLAASIMVKQAGLEPVLQLTCRDRNRLALQADLIGAASFGINTVLALSGDHVVMGDHPHAKTVYDIDSLNLARMMRMMRDGPVFENGETIPKIAPDFFVGAVENPFAPPYEFRPVRVAKKVAAGAQFIQTQSIYNVPRFREFMARIVDLGLHEKVAILAGIGPVRSPKALEYMRNDVAGMDVPEWIDARFAQVTTKEDYDKVGLDLACELAEQIRQIEGVRGVHIMAGNWTAVVPQIVTALGLFPRP